MEHVTHSLNHKPLWLSFPLQPEGNLRKRHGPSQSYRESSPEDYQGET